MVSKTKVRKSAKTLFGEQLKRYRETAGLSQLQFSELMGTGETYISKAERGILSIGLDNVDKYAEFFGAEYYEFGNPKHPLPTFEELPKASQRKINQLKKKGQQAKAKAAADKAAQKEEGVPGRAKQLHGLLAKGFFKKPRTAKDAFTKLNPSIEKSDIPNHLAEIKKITSTLSQGKFRQLLDKLKATEGNTAVRFREKTNA